MRNLATGELEDPGPYHRAVIAADEASMAYWEARNKIPPEVEEALHEDLSRIHEDYIRERDERIARFEADHGLTELAAAKHKADEACAEYEEGEDDDE